MDLYQAIESRYSCRNYQDKSIEPEKLDRILAAARLAPSARNIQDWRFVVATDKQIIEKLSVACNNQSFVAKAAAVIVGCSDSDYVMRCGQKISAINLAIAMEHIALSATAEGLATCWLGSFFPEQVRAVVGIPENIEIIELMAIGYPADAKTDRVNKPLEEIVSRNRWSF